MERENLFNEIERFMVKIKDDYQNNIINIDKYELMCIELDSLTENLSSGDLLILTTKFYTTKTIYLIMK